MTSLVPGLNITRYQADLEDSDRATAQTIQLMREQIDRASKDPVLCAAARDAVRRFRGGPLYVRAGVNPWTSPQAIAESAWWWVKHALRFVHHNGLIQVWFNERDQLQLLISPDLLLRMKDPRGDCAIYTMLECAMLKCFGIGYELVTAAVTPGSPDYDHVWGRAVLGNRRLNLDASHGSYPGWQVPFEHRNRTQVWDEHGNPIEDVAPRGRGLHGYQALARPNTPILPKRLALVPGVGFGSYIRRRGLGQNGSVDTIVDPATGNVYDTSGNLLSGTVSLPSAFGPVPTPAPTAPTGPSAASTLENALAQSSPGLLAAWTKIAGNVIAPQVQLQTGPGGTSYSAPAGSAAAAAGIPGIPAFGNIGSMLPLLLLGGVVIFLFVGMSKR
jgi:hypothetical protein